jgi:ATP-dependent DNA helicase DinG
MGAAEWLSDPAKGIARTIRPAQVEMATTVEKILQEKGVAMIEAGTGTGKSFGYLVPAILSGKRVVVSTAKKGLQKQLRDDDLPFLLKQMGATVSFASLKGKNNYGCRLRTADFVKSDAALRFDVNAISDFCAWLETNTYGELDDFNEDVDFVNYVRVSECIGTHCEAYGSCGYRLAKSRAGCAQIVVVNHALLAFDLSMGGGKIVGPYDAVIIDEAHQAAKYFREAYTSRIQSKQPDTLRKLLQDTSLVVPETLESKVGRFLADLPERGILQPNQRVVDNALGVLQDLARLKQQFINEGVWSELAAADEEDDRYAGKPAKELSRLRAAATLTQRMTEACSACALRLDEVFLKQGLQLQDYVSYVETRMHRNEMHREVIVTPIEIGPLVGPALRRIDSVVFTSATLSTGGNFDYVSRDFGLRSSDIKVGRILPPVFDYKARSCLYVSDVTAPYARDTKLEYWRTCAATMHDMCSASRGGAFILCASYEDMTAFYDRLAGLGGTTYEVRAQSGNVDNLIGWFKATKNAVAIGMKSLWEGVDIPGFGLRLVIIPRLPFPNPDDPIFTARKNRYIERQIKDGADANKASIIAWQHYDLQEAIMDFKQGAGRLIRRETDMGVVAVLDNRVFGRNKGYAPTIRNSIPHPHNPDYASTKKLLALLSTKV